MTEEASTLRDALIFLTAAVAIVPACRWARINPVIGYLAAGAVIGPHALALVREVEGAHRLAEFGVVFMLFMIGLELSPERLKVMARYVFGLGSAQVALSGLALGLGAWLAGETIGQAAVIGGALALSSTAFVLQLLSERGELATQRGRVILAVLLMQDLAVVPGLAVVVALGNDPDALAWSLAASGLKAVVALVALFAAGRVVLRPLYRVIAEARSPEVFAAATLLVVLGTAWVTELAGLSMALGAFLAGLMLAGTEYRHQIEGDVRPVRGILLGLFFMSVGMLLELPLVVAELPKIVLLVLVLVSVKAIVLVILGLLFGLGLPLAVNVGLHLAQGGEFAFVLFSLAMGTAILPLETGQALLGAVAISMALTPLLAAAGRRAHVVLERPGRATLNISQKEADLHSDHVIIAGFGRVGRTVARILDQRGQNWIAVDSDAATVACARRQGLPVFFGHADQDAVMKAVGVERARSAVVTMNDTAAALSAVRGLRRSLPDLPILVRARDLDHMKELADAGATSIVPEMTEASLLLGEAVLLTLGTSQELTNELLTRFRRDAYALMGDLPRPSENPGANEATVPIVHGQS